MARRKVRLFVYGTLKSDGPAHALIQRLPGARLVGRHTVRGRLVHNGSYLAAELEGDGEIAGELWEFLEGSLEEIDAYEGEDYERRRVRVAGRWAWIYVLRLRERG